ncbi:MAG TPA: winged helix-turn-helix domain-containing protein [Blastocatellia bacterium]|nr:winged helix-turn-helix domain-containing protein [Blastocatellia bacterium]
MNRGVRIYYHFGPFQLDVAARILLRDGNPVPLTPKIFDTLLLLLQHRDKLVERTHLIQTVWHDDYVEEGNISSTIYLLRKALGDNRNGQGYIVTVPRQGYRFTMPVEEICVPEHHPAILSLDSIAVLPFRPLCSEEDSEGLSLGLADALITQLGNCRELTVRPTSAVRKYMDWNVDSVTAGLELNVEAVVECNFQRAGDRIRVTAQLISIKDGGPLWAATYNEQFTDLFMIEDILSNSIAADLRSALFEKSVTTPSILYHH